MSKGTKGIIAVIVALVIIIGVFAVVNSRGLEADADGNSVSIVINGNETAVYTIDDLREMEGINTIHKTISSGSKEDETGDFTGVAVRDLLLSADEGCLDNASGVNVTSGDGFVSSYSMDEIMEDDNIMLIFEQDGEPLPHFNDGGSGPLRIVVMKDQFGNRSAMWVTQISVEQ